MGGELVLAQLVIGGRLVKGQFVMAGRYGAGGELLVGKRATSLVQSLVVEKSTGDC